MINHKHKFIFIHVPKCGGTSISKLKNFCVKNEGLSDHLPYLPNSVSKGDSSSYSRNYPGAKNYKYFTIVRNPWDRAVSTYFYLQSMNEDHIHYYWNEYMVKYIQSNNLTFEQFIDIIGGKNYKECFFDRWHHENNNRKIENILFPNQASFLKPNLQDMDYIGRFENLQEDFNTICDKIGIPQQKLPHKNKSKHKHYTEYYNDETRQIVADYYAKDIEHFGYEFGE